MSNSLTSLSLLLELLNPGDRNLSFILEREKEVSTSLNLRQPIKRIAIFRTPRNHYFICYDGKEFIIKTSITGN